MSRFILGFLALCALALVIGPTDNKSNPQQSGWQIADNTNANNGGVLIIETYSASSLPVPTQDETDMQPLPENPGVEVAPDSNTSTTSSEPIMVEEDDMLVQENE